MDNCNFGPLSERKKDYGFVPIPVVKAGDITSLGSQTLRQVSFTIAANPKTGFIPFYFVITPQDDVGALNKLFKKEKTAKMDEDNEPLGGPLHAEDPRQWDIGDRVGGRYKTPQDIKKELKFHRNRAGVTPACGTPGVAIAAGAGPTGDDSLPKQIARTTDKLARCKAAEIDLRFLMRRQAIALYLR